MAVRVQLVVGVGLTHLHGNVGFELKLTHEMTGGMNRHVSSHNKCSGKFEAQGARPCAVLVSRCGTIKSFFALADG
jgi:hypothetical protein